MEAVLMWIIRGDLIFKYKSWASLILYIALMSDIRLCYFSDSRFSIIAVVVLLYLYSFSIDARVIMLLIREFFCFFKIWYCDIYFEWNVQVLNIFFPLFDSLQCLLCSLILVCIGRFLITMYTCPQLQGILFTPSSVFGSLSFLLDFKYSSNFLMPLYTVDLFSCFRTLSVWSLGST